MDIYDGSIHTFTENSASFTVDSRGEQNFFVPELEIKKNKRWWPHLCDGAGSDYKDWLNGSWLLLCQPVLSVYFIPSCTPCVYSCVLWWKNTVRSWSRICIAAGSDYSVCLHCMVPHTHTHTHTYQQQTKMYRRHSNLYFKSLFYIFYS